MDIKKYFGTPMETCKYRRLHKWDIPQMFIDQHKFEEIFDKNGYVYMEIQQGNVRFEAIREDRKQ